MTVRTYVGADVVDTTRRVLFKTVDRAVLAPAELQANFDLGDGQFDKVSP